MQGPLYIGLMSGTSMDGIDAVLADFNVPGGQVLDANSLPMPARLREQLLDLQHPGHDELARANRAALQLADLYVQACRPWTQGPYKSALRAIGVHGQTIRHAPDQGYTLQLNAPAYIAEHSGVDVIADFRSRDIAAGGQGAPLVPIVHDALFRCAYGRVVLNMGGIANISLLLPNQAVSGFDTGPANMLLDAWIQRHQGLPYDRDSQWAASATPDAMLLATLLSEPWLQLPPPKSTGRDLFNLQWLDRHLTDLYGNAGIDAAVVQATLLELTVRSIAQAIHSHAPQAQEVLACGGGAANPQLLARLSATLGLPVRSTSQLGLDPQHIEALAFAWLAHAYIERIPAGLPSVTGARRPSVLGACYPA
ncbi:MAG TPA: anhydro-N-acetylmuramic acid kinase [Alcaligenes sp.]|nr:anhydro-N-acetylmuramic acid kinase [Alcaligenes sp.]HRL27211.1 anhydro-N-acetylmuramic acid kinase [Alcaligenes sp.]